MIDPNAIREQLRQEVTAQVRREPLAQYDRWLADAVEAKRAEMQTTIDELVAQIAVLDARILAYEEDEPKQLAELERLNGQLSAALAAAEPKE